MKKRIRKADKAYIARNALAWAAVIFGAFFIGVSLATFRTVAFH